MMPSQLQEHSSPELVKPIETSPIRNVLNNSKQLKKDWFLQSKVPNHMPQLLPWSERPSTSVKFQPPSIRVHDGILDLQVSTSTLRRSKQGSLSRILPNRDSQSAFFLSNVLTEEMLSESQQEGDLVVVGKDKQILSAWQGNEDMGLRELSSKRGEKKGGLLEKIRNNTKRSGARTTAMKNTLYNPIVKKPHHLPPPPKRPFPTTTTTTAATTFTTPLAADSHHYFATTTNSNHTLDQYSKQEEKANDDFPNQMDSLRFNLFKPLHHPDRTLARHTYQEYQVKQPRQLSYLRHIYNAKNNNIGFVLKRNGLRPQTVEDDQPQVGDIFALERPASYLGRRTRLLLL
ncbi:hypothetical protein FGO68_gene13597 [Halteria grandinella]|uniref:Uncharacterized protein n=1 Tax=Halteria grandinella TaxID=5974 RepID=A0A8J8NDS6_HALGN|nr:hypothetical protein FGO68_gene13597 [Halteria grandinella]